jgi:hypothetical protein
LGDEATRKTWEGVGEVAEAGKRAGAEWADSGGVLPGARVVRAVLLRLEKAAARGGYRARCGWRPAHEVRGSATGSGGVGRSRDGAGGSGAECGCGGCGAWGQLARSSGAARVEILLKNGRSLRVGPGFDAELVRALMAVVESAA